MKPTQRKDAVRNIRKQIVSYLSIIIIAMLAVLTYLGVNFGALSVGLAGSDFYNRNNYRDIHILSTYLLTPADMEAIRQVEGVADVEGVYRTEAKIYMENSAMDVFVASMTQRINTAELVEGRMPEAPGECVIESEISNAQHIEVGDTIEVANALGEDPMYLTRTEFTVTGIINHPDHACWQRFVPDKPYVIVLEDVFDREALEGCYMTAEIRVEGLEGSYRFGDAYINNVAPTLERLNALADERAVIRYNEIRGMYQEQIDEGQAELDDANAQLTDARGELDSGWSDYFDGLDQLTQSANELQDAQQQLAAGWDELESVRLQIEDGEAQLAAARIELNNGWAQLMEARAELDMARAQLAAGEATLQEARQKLDDSKVQLDHAWAQLQSGAAELDNAEQILETGRIQLLTGFTLLEDIKQGLRDTLYITIAHTLGQNVADRISWTPRVDNIDLDDPNASINIFAITPYLSIDFDKSLTENIAALLEPIGVPDPEGSAATIVSYSGSIEHVYEFFASMVGYWESGHEAYLNGKALYESGLTTYEQYLQLYNYGYAQYQAGLQMYNEGEAEYNEKRAQYEEGEARYAEGMAEYQARRAQYEDAQQQLADARQRYNEGLAQYEESQAQIEEGEQAIASGQNELDDAYIALESGEAEYNDGLDQYNEGVDQLNQAIEDMELLDECHWVVLDVYGNGAYIFIRNNAESISNLGGTFASIFVVVGALVVLATVGRIIDEQRHQVGATKAFGFFNKEILGKYLVFGVSATFVGMFLGVIFGFTIIQWIVTTTYGQFYVYGTPRMAFDLKMTFIILAGGIVLSALTVWFACNSLLKLSAVTLLNDLVPHLKKKAREGKNSQRTGGLYARLIVLNMLSDKKRVIVTIVSIAGSCALLVTGLTMNVSIKKSINAQFDDIICYSHEIVFDPAISAEAEEEIEQELIDLGVEYIAVRDVQQPYDANGRLSTINLICGDINEINEYLTRRDHRTNEVITGYNGGAWVYHRLLEKTGSVVGDRMTIYDSAMNPHHINIEGTFRNYFGNYTIMNEEAYTNLFDEEPVHNTFLVRLNGAGEADLKASVRSIKGFMEINDTEGRREATIELVSVLDVLSVLFVAIAAMMDYFVLLNLINMYINQKTRELTIMRINGFSVKETKRYVSLEIVVSTVLGIILGCLAGIALAHRVITVLEPTDIFFTKSVQYGAIGIASLISSVFTAITATWALRKVKHLKLTDINN